jgi:serine/threonine-protein kinase
MVSDVLVGDRYALGEVIGSGGAGSVRLARDTVLDRRVAIKRLRPGQDEVQRARLRIEARLAAGLHHPGIAQVYDFGEDEVDGEASPYLVMEYVAGTSLWQVLRDRGTLPPGEVMDLVAQVARALEVAHAAGIVHRDLKPGNILVTPSGRAVLVDFGIARSQEADPLTLTGSIVGTVDYISPEQSGGASATPLSDLYSLGMVAYECLTGLKPLRRETQIATVLAQLNDEIPPLGPEVPAPVARLVMEMTRKRPERRPAGAAEVARRAEALAGDRWAARMPLTETVSWRPPVWRRRFVPPSRSRLVLVAGALATALVAGGLFAAARAPADAKVPDLKGKQIGQADRVLRDRGLEVDRVTVDRPDTPWGIVLRQTPTPGSAADADTVVTLTVSSGWVHVESARLVGLPYEQAARLVTSWGMEPRRSEVVRDTGAGTVVSVLRSGRLLLGSPVDLVVAVPASEPVVAPTPSAPTHHAGHGPGRKAKGPGHGHKHAKHGKHKH